MANRRYNTQVANDRACMAKGGSTSKYHTTKEGKKKVRRVHLQKLQLKNHKRNV
jgi:hypothetical protein